MPTDNATQDLLTINESQAAICTTLGAVDVSLIQ